MLLTGKDYLDRISVSIRDEIEDELRRLEYFVRVNARVKNTHYPLAFPVKHCHDETVQSLKAVLEACGWKVDFGNKDFLFLTPLSTKKAK